MDEGAVHETIAVVPEAVAVTLVGVPGTVGVEVLLTGVEASEVPTLLVAVTEIEYVIPALRPTKVQLVFETEVGAQVTGAVPPVAITVYAVIGVPPVDEGGCQ